MKKGFIGVLVCMALIINSFGCLISVSAANDLPLSYSAFEGDFAKLEAQFILLSFGQQRDLYDMVTGNFVTDPGIANLIKALQDIYNGVSTGITDIDNLIADLIAADPTFLTSYKKDIPAGIFGLTIFQSVSAANRKTAVLGLGTRAKGYKDYTKYAFGADLAVEAAISELYDAFKTTSVDGMMQARYGADKKAVAFQFLSYVFKDSFVLDTEGGALVIATIDSGFADKLAANAKKNLQALVPAFDSVGGVSLTSSGEKILGTVIKVVGDAAKDKKVLDDLETALSDNNMWVKPVAPTPTPTKSPGSSSSGGTSGGSFTVVMPQPDLDGPVTDEVGKPLVIADPKSPPLNILDKYYDFDQYHWAAAYVATMSQKGVFNGYDDSSFKPEIDITRQEIAVTIIRSLGLQTGVTTRKAFADLEDIGAWAMESVYLCDQLGIMVGYDDGSFKPQQPISREEFAVVLSRVLTVNRPTLELPFKDSDSVAWWSRAGVEKAYTCGLIKGYEEDNSFRPTNAISRAEVATMLYRFMAVEKKL